jgi:hypothetical protein
VKWLTGDLVRAQSMLLADQNLEGRIMRRRREERKREKETFGRKGTATRYQMRQKLVAFGDDFYITNEAGQKVYKVDGKVLRVPDPGAHAARQGHDGHRRWARP